MRQFLTTLLAATALMLISSPAQAQIRFDFHDGGWGYQPGVTISVGSGGGYYGPAYQTGYVYNQGYYNNRRYRRRYRQRYDNCNSAYWCQAHNMYCTHRYVQNQAYWCQAHREYCTH